MTARRTSVRRTPGSAPWPLVDPAVVRARRLELGLSAGVLAGALGVNSAVVVRLESGGVQGQYTWAFLAVLAEVLGLAPADLLTGPSDDLGPVDVPDDVSSVGALLAAQPNWSGLDELADVLGWNRPQLCSALDGLEASLAPTGMALAWVGEEWVRIVPAVPLESLPRLEGSLNRDQGLDVAEHRTLWRLAAGQRSEQVAREDERARRQLERLGLVRTIESRAGATIELTDSARFCLCLDEV
jgi:transcriptional regulator with XRE-family HTH domain